MAMNISYSRLDVHPCDLLASSDEFPNRHPFPRPNIKESRWIGSCLHGYHMRPDQVHDVDIIPDAGPVLGRMPCTLNRELREETQRGVEAGT